jgi:hypothetical protein
MRNKTEAEIDEDTYLTPNNPNIIETNWFGQNK